MNEKQIKHLLDECRMIDENCLYTGQTHFIMASKAQRKVMAMVFFPSLVAVLAGAYAAICNIGWVGAIASVAAGFAGLASVLGVDRDVIAHNSAGNLMTSLRHQARALHESLWREMTRDALYTEVRRLCDKYQIIRLALEPTDNKAFEEARKRIKEGLFEPDFRMKKSITDQSK